MPGVTTPSNLARSSLKSDNMLALKEASHSAGWPGGGDCPDGDAEEPVVR